MRSRPTLISAAVAAAALPARAAVIQTAPVYTKLGGDLVLDPGRFLPFDASLGTLNGVTLGFDGTVGFSAEAFIIGPPPYQTELTAYPTVSSVGLANVAFTPLVAPITITETGSDLPPYGRASAYAPQNFKFVLLKKCE